MTTPNAMTIEVMSRRQDAMGQIPRLSRTRGWRSTNLAATTAPSVGVYIMTAEHSTIQGDLSPSPSHNGRQASQAMPYAITRNTPMETHEERSAGSWSITP